MKRTVMMSWVAKIGLAWSDEFCEYAYENIATLRDERSMLSCWAREGPRAKILFSRAVC